MKLTIEKRALPAQDIRKQGKIPCVFYGPKVLSTPIAVDAPSFMKVWKSAGESAVITLSGVDGEHDALIHDMQRDPVTGEVKHADFYIIEKGKKVEVAIPLEFIGTSPAVKNLNGTLIKVLHELEIEAMPKDLPHSIEIDISILVDFDTQIKASDVKLPSGVTLKTDPEEIIALVNAPKEETEEEPVGSIDMSAIGISEERGKKEDAEVASE
jgi:large subunit ribosomal protein L25